MKRGQVICIHVPVSGPHLGTICTGFPWFLSTSPVWGPSPPRLSGFQEVEASGLELGWVGLGIKAHKCHSVKFHFVGTLSLA